MESVVELLSLTIDKGLSFLSSWPGAFIFLVIIFKKGLGSRLGDLRGLFRKSRETFSELGVGTSGVNLKFRDIKTINTAIGETNISVVYSREFIENYLSFSSGTFRYQLSWPSKGFKHLIEPDKIDEYARRVGMSEIHRSNIRFILLYEEDLGGNSFVENINVYTHPVSTDTTIDQYLNELLNALSIRDFDIASIDQQNSSAVVQYSLRIIDGMQITFSQRIAINNGIAYQVTATQRTSSLTNLMKQKLYRGILNTFKLLLTEKNI